MLKKAERLTHSLFLKYLKTGKRLNNNYITVIYHPYDSFFGAVVVGKKVAKKAVRRNLIRRRIYAILRKIKGEKNNKGVYIVIAKPNINSLTQKQFQTIITEEVGRSLK